MRDHGQVQQIFEVASPISFGQFYLLSEGHLDPESPEIDELVQAALDGNGFATGPGTVVALVPDLVDGVGELVLAIQQRTGPIPGINSGEHECRVDVGSDGLILRTVEEATACRIPVAPGSYRMRISQQPSPVAGEVSAWSVYLFEEVAAASTTAKRRRSTMSREQKVEQLAAGLPNSGPGGAWWQFPKVRLDDEYDEILWDLAPSVTDPVIVNLHRTGITRLPRWLTRVPMVIGLLAHENDLDELPDWLPELSELRRLAVSDNRRLTALPANVAELRHLNRLEIDGTGIQRIPDVVRTLRRLELLDVSDTSICELPEWLGELLDLSRLVLRKSQIDQLPESLHQRVEDGLLTILR